MVCDETVVNLTKLQLHFQGINETENGMDQAKESDYFFGPISKFLQDCFKQMFNVLSKQRI